MFHSWIRQPLQSPLSQVIYNRFSSGDAFLPTHRHHCATLSPTNSDVLWLVPRLTKPVLSFNTYTPYGETFSSSDNGKAWCITFQKFLNGQYSTPLFFSCRHSFFLCIDWDDRISINQKLWGCFINTTKPRTAIRMPSANLVHFLILLLAVAKRVKYS